MPRKRAASGSPPPAEEGAKGKPSTSTGAGATGGKAAAGQGRKKKASVEIPEPAQLSFCADQPLIQIGCSGYSYPHWRKGAYYPAGLPTAREFEMYAKEFNMLELNATFYGWFSEETFDAWRERAAAARPSFTYVVKASQFYTHKKKLNVDDNFRESWGRFWARCERLRPHLGPVLFQFPSNFKPYTAKKASNIDRLRALGEVLLKGEKFVFEFRDRDWYCPEVYQVLREHDWCLALVEAHSGEGAEAESSGSDEGKLQIFGGGGAAGKSWLGTLREGLNPPLAEYPLDACSWGVYVRLHGLSGQYCGTYGPQAMSAWAQRAAEWAGTGRIAYFAFNNDAVSERSETPSAILDCRYLAAVLGKRGLMRFDTSKVTSPLVHAARPCSGGGCADLEEPPFCIPADGVRCKGCRFDEATGACYRNNCDALFTPRPLRQRQRGWRCERPQLIIAAGPERSGSTWLYNAVRLIFEHAEQPLDAYWLTRVTDSALDARGAGRPGSHHVLVKTHEWSEGWDLGQADHIFITHRDLRQVLRSYRRLGWASDVPRGYVEDHLKWREVAELNIAFEDIVGQPHSMVAELVQRLGLHDKVDPEAVVAAISSLPVPTEWVDPVTQMWPSHISTPYLEERKRTAEAPPKQGEGATAQGGTEGLGSPRPAGPPTPRGALQGGRADKADSLKQRYPEFFELYGYE